MSVPHWAVLPCKLRIRLCRSNPVLEQPIDAVAIQRNQDASRREQQHADQHQERSEERTDDGRNARQDSEKGHDSPLFGNSLHFAVQ